MEKGKYLQIWKDLGQKGAEHVGLWARTSMDVDKGIDANVFTSFKSYDFPKESPNILSSDYAKHVLFEPAFTTKIPALSAYKREDADRIWYDKGSGAGKNFSVWRPKGLQHYYNLGDYPVSRDYPASAYDKPSVDMYVFRANKDNVLTSPFYYVKKWDDSRSGADEDVSFWRPVCPDGYVPTGHVASKRHDNAPSRDDIKCLKCDFETMGKWDFVWNDKGSGAKDDVIVYELNIIPNAMRANKPHEKLYDAHGIKDSEIHYVDMPAENFIVSEVQYKYNEATFDRQQYQMQKITLNNVCRNTVKTLSQKIGYGFMERRRWDHDSDLEPSLNTEVEASLPFGSDGKVSIYSIDMI